MVRFSGKHDKVYQMVKDDIEEAIVKAQAQRDPASGMLA
jgi:hypothetical protein